MCRFGCIFFLFYLGLSWNPVFCCKLSWLQQQQLRRIQWRHSVTDQTDPGPEPQWKSCAWQAYSLGFAPRDPKWTNSEVFDLLGVCGKLLSKTPWEVKEWILLLCHVFANGSQVAQHWVKNPTSMKPNGKNECSSSDCQGPNLSKLETWSAPSLLPHLYPLHLILTWCLPRIFSCHNDVVVIRK